MSKQEDQIPQRVGEKKLDNHVEELADYLSVNCPDEYEAIVQFGQLRFIQGMKHGKQVIDESK